MKQPMNESSVSRFKEFVEERTKTDSIHILDCPGCCYLSRCLRVGYSNCKYVDFSMVEYIVGQLSIRSMITRSIFLDDFKFKIKRIFKLLFQIFYWKLHMIITIIFW